jgi:hypothetical protein
MVTNHTGQLSPVADAQLETLVIRKLSQGTFDERLAVFNGSFVIYPRQPYSQMRPVGMYQVKEFLCMSFLEQTQFGIVVNVYA